MVAEELMGQVVRVGLNSLPTDGTGELLLCLIRRWCGQRVAFFESYFFW